MKEIEGQEHNTLSRVGRHLAVALGFQLLAIAVLWQVSLIEPGLRISSGIAAVFPSLEQADIDADLNRERRSFLSYADGSIQTYAYMSTVFRALDQGTIALWDFSTQSGNSFIATIETAPLYPVTLLLALISEPSVGVPMDYWVVFHFGLAAWFMFLLLRHWDVSSTSSVLGACIFAFIGAVGNRAVGQPNTFAGLVYMPLVLLLFDRALSKRAPIHRNPMAIGAGLALGMMILAGHMQPYVHTAILLGFFTTYSSLVWRTGPPVHSFSILAGVGLVSAMFAGPVLFPALEYLDLTNRWYGGGYVQGTDIVPYEHYGFDYVLKLSDWKSLFGPVGDIPDAGTLYFTRVGLGLACLAIWKRGAVALFCLGVAVLSVVISLGDATLLGPITYYTPFLNRIREPIRILVLYNLAVATLAAIGFDVLRNASKRWEPVHWIALLSVTGLFIAELSIRSVRLSAPSDMPSHPRQAYARGLVIDTMIERQAEWNYAYRFASQPADILPANIGNRYELFSLGGHRATMLSTYFDYLSTDWSPEGKIFDQLAVRDLVSNKPLAGFQEVVNADGLWLYERPNPLPIFRVLAPGHAAEPAEIETIVWGQNNVHIRLKGGQAGTLVFAQPDFPGWNAQVDGKARAIGNEGIFMALQLDARDREIELWYLPTGFGLYCLLSFSTIATLGVATWVSQTGRESVDIPV